jgi:hypothetical protein
MTEDTNYIELQFVRYAELGWNPIPIPPKTKKAHIKWERYQTDRSTERQDFCDRPGHRERLPGADRAAS